MPHTEFPPQDLFSRLEASQSPYPGIQEQLGSVALHNEVSDVEHSYIEGGLSELEAMANGDDIRAEDAGRVHDVAAAHEAALQEEVLRVHEAALQENELFDAYRENEIFDAYTEALREDEERAEQKEQRNTLESDKPTAGHEAGQTQSDFRQQAESALKEAGYPEQIPAGSQVSKDPATGHLMIISSHEVKVLESYAGGTRVVDYKFNQDNNVLTISAPGFGAAYGRAGEYVASDTHEGQQAGPEVITLPLAIARMAGFRKAVPISRHAQ